jgi:hypothetical protein
MQQIRFINDPLTQHVSGTIMPILRSARPYIAAYFFQHLSCWLEPWGAGKQAVCTVEDVTGVLENMQQYTVWHS